MTDITKLLEEHPLPWTPWHPWMDRPDVVMDASGQCVRLTQSIVLALANALHAERQKNAEEVSEHRATLRHHAEERDRRDPPLNDSGDVDALRYRIGELEKRLDAIANAARGSDD